MKNVLLLMLLTLGCVVNAKDNYIKIGVTDVVPWCHRYTLCDHTHQLNPAACGGGQLDFFVMLTCSDFI